MSINHLKMTTKIQRRRQEQIGAKTAKKWKRNCEGRHDVAEASQKSKWRPLHLQSKDATKVALV